VEEMKNLHQMQHLAEKLLWLAHVKRLWTRVVDSKKQTPRLLMMRNSGLCTSGKK
jgi:hypothetical protein